MTVNQNDLGFFVDLFHFVMGVCFLFILGEKNWSLAFNSYLLCPVVICQRTKHTVSALDGVYNLFEKMGLSLNPNTLSNIRRKLMSDSNMYNICTICTNIKYY